MTKHTAHITDYLMTTSCGSRAAVTCTDATASTGSVVSPMDQVEQQVCYFETL